MAHPLKQVIAHNHQMAGIFDDLVDSLKHAGQSAIDKGKAAAITNTFSTILQDKQVQSAIQEQANESAIQKLAAELRSAQTNVVSYVRDNPQKTMLIAAAAGISVIGLIIYLRKR